MTSYLSILACCLLWEWSCCLGCSAGCWAESVFLLLTPGLGQVTWKYKELLFICLNRDYLYNLSKARVRGVEPFWDYIIWNWNCSTYLCTSSLEDCLFSWHPLHLQGLVTWSCWYWLCPWSTGETAILGFCIWNTQNMIEKIQKLLFGS